MSADRLTTNFHQSRCGRVRIRGQDNVGVPGLPPASLKILQYLLGILACCVEMWPFGLLRSKVHNPCEKLVYFSLHGCTGSKKIDSNNIFHVMWPCLMIYPHQHLSLLFILCYSPLFSSILSMVCIDLFPSTN